MSRELIAYATIYKDQGWSSDDVKFFEEKRLQLSRVAEELGHAAQKRNSPEVTKVATSVFVPTYSGSRLQPNFLTEPVFSNLKTQEP